MKQSLGQKLSALRKEHGLTQETVAAWLGVTPQAVSKWENDLSCPDILLLPDLSKLYGVTVDALLGAEIPKKETPANEKAQAARQPDKAGVALDRLFFKVFVNTKAGEQIKVQIPMPVIQGLLKVGFAVPELSNLAGFNLSEIPLEQIFQMVEDGLVGELMILETELGDQVRIVVEEK